MLTCSSFAAALLVFAAAASARAANGFSFSPRVGTPHTAFVIRFRAPYTDFWPDTEFRYSLTVDGPGTRCDFPETPTFPGLESWFAVSTPGVIPRAPADSFGQSITLDGKRVTPRRYRGFKKGTRVVLRTRMPSCPGRYRGDLSWSGLDNENAISTIGAFRFRMVRGAAPFTG